MEIRLVGLYGKLNSNRYGNLESNLLYSKDVTSQLAAKTVSEDGAMMDDTRRISGWTETTFRWAVDAGIINGIGNGKISPRMNASRAQAATMLMRYEDTAK